MSPMPSVLWAEGQPPHPGSPYARPHLAKFCPPLKSQLTGLSLWRSSPFLSWVRVSSSELLLVLLLAAAVLPALTGLTCL